MDIGAYDGGLGQIAPVSCHEDRLRLARAQLDDEFAEWVAVGEHSMV